MTAKEELNQYKYARKKVDETLEEYQKYKDRAEKMTSIISDMPRGTNNGDKVADNATIMADLSKEYERRWVEAEKEKLRIEQNIDNVEEPYRTLLHMKYIEDIRLDEIAYKMHYSFDRIRHMHGEALLKYERLAHDSTQKHI